MIIDHYIHYRVLQELWNKHINKLEYVDRFSRVNNHNNPPSTHVERIDSVGAAIKYVNKYVCKSDTSGIVDGRKWEASKAVKELKPISYWLDSDIEQYINYLIDKDKVYVYNSEYFSVLFYNKKYDWNVDNTFVEAIERRDYISIYNDMYGNKNVPAHEAIEDTEKTKPVGMQYEIEFDTPRIPDLRFT